ncbi:uncharacterized protein LOC125019015 [Mugil cephalus]|uniref:uncharacterized protein LOC125019015 n=1 Tax=Mugil cephalus TaxID=48193 RepID=UPI001FB61517|nr:uncharacterized protein LOC125019015 [Mugil cephalus]
MEGSAQFCLLVVLLFVASDSAEAQNTPSYFKLGGTMTLRPPFTDKITSIVYKFKGNMVAEYADNGVPLTYYTSFRGRTTLNIGTGELVIKNMGKDDIGEFVVEINNVVQRQRFESVEIKEVPDPVVTARPLSCCSSSSSCGLWCYGEIKESGPVTFYWRKDDGEWKESEQVMNITNDEETKKVKTFSCRMKNPVSEKESESEQNPFWREEAADSGKESEPEQNPFWREEAVLERDSGLRAELIGVVVRSFVVLLVSGLLVFLLWRKRKLICSCKCGKGDDEEDDEGL